MDNKLASDRLTPREEQVQRLVEDGLTNRQIGAKLGLKRNAIRFHIKRLHSKLDTSGERTELEVARKTGRWSWLPLALPHVATCLGVVVLSAAGVAGVYWAHSTHSGDAESVQERIVEINAWPGLTAAELAQVYQTTEARIRELNPGQGPGPYAGGEVLRVVVPPSMTIAQIAPTPRP